MPSPTQSVKARVHRWRLEEHRDRVVAIGPLEKAGAYRYPITVIPESHLAALQADNEATRAQLDELAQWCEEKAAMARREADTRSKTDDADQSRIDYCDGEAHAWIATADRIRASLSTQPSSKGTQ